MPSLKQEVHDYIVSQVNIFIEPLVMELVTHKPSDPIAFSIKWLTSYQAKNKLATKTSESESESEEQENQDVVKELDKKISDLRAKRTNKSRIGISEEAFGLFNKSQELVLHQSNKSQDIKTLVRSLVRNSILFQNVDSKDEDVLINAMSRIETQEHEMIIKQGEAGDILYIVESGQYDCYKKMDSQNCYVKTYQYGEAFGQLALMYNAPRAASIVTKTKGSLLMLDRVTFSQVLKVSAMRKRTILSKAIEKIQIFKFITSNQQQQLYNIVKEERFNEGQYIIKQGEKGNKFYIVLDGTLIAQKKQPRDELPKIVFKYEVCQYFGQLALINDIDRQASIKALTNVKVGSISRVDFKRVFGQLQNAFKQHSHIYQ